jgi:hypothetical protein
MHTGTNFDYEVELEYSDDAYGRTGQQLLDANVINPALVGLLPPTGPYSATNLKQEVAVFVRWVPGFWKGKVSGLSGATLPALSLFQGAHLSNLFGTLTDAQNEVVHPTQMTSHTGTNKLKRQNSGTLAGFFETAAQMGSNMVSVGNAPSFSAHMFQPEPQDIRDQPFATSTPSGGTPKVLPASSITFDLLKEVVDVGSMAMELDNVQTMHKSKYKSLAAPSVDQAAKKVSKNYGVLRKRRVLKDAKQGVVFLKAVQAVLAKKKSKNPTGMAHFSKIEFAKAVKKSALTPKRKRKMLSLLFDKNLT